MTRVDFYQVDSEETPLLFTCRLIEKAYRQSHQIYIHTTSKDESEELDDLLWSFRPDRFIPHSLQMAVETAPIKIGHDHEPVEHQDFLINLSGEVPDFFSRFVRVAEIVPLSEASRDSARLNYKFYKDRGYQLNYHDMKKTAKQKNG